VCPIARLLSDLLAQHLDFGVSDCFPGFGNSLAADTAQGTTFSLGDPLESNGDKHLKVAHYEVVGSRFSKATRPVSVRDDRLAAGAREAVCEPRTERSIVPPGRSYL
jgi:hypothetical protein